MKMLSLQDLFIEELRDLYSAENMLLKALPKLARAATNPALRAGLEEHLEQTRAQKERLERVFEGLGQKPKAKTCEGMKGIIEEGEATMKQDAEDATMDAALIGAAQKAEHYEIATYGTVRTWARTLGLVEAAQQLQQTLDEEEQTDQKLTAIATTVVNAMAAAGEEEGTEDVEEVGRARGRRAFAGTGDEDEGEAEHEEIEGMMEEEEEEEEAGVIARGSKGRTGNPTTTGRGNAGSKHPGEKPTRRGSRRRERSKS
jgi:ferritin-like metal-binding protein YciE